MYPVSPTFIRSVYAVGIPCRRCLLDSHDGRYRLPVSQCDRMLRNDKSEQLPRFAGQRVRMAEVLVEKCWWS